MAKNIVCIIANFNKSYSSRQVVWVLGVDCKNIKKAIKRRCSLETNGDAFWLNKKSKNHGSGLCEATVQQIVVFWTLGTTISPNAKDVTRKRTGVKKYEEHATHYL